MSLPETTKSLPFFSPDPHLSAIETDTNPTKAIDRMVYCGILVVLSHPWSSVEADAYITTHS
jgi:hypothetical protein